MPAPTTAATPPIDTYKTAVAVVPEQRKFFGFLQKPRASDANAAKKEKKPKRSKADKAAEKAAAKKTGTSITATGTAVNENNTVAVRHAPFAPAKRIVEHHEYQNIIDEAAAIRMVERLPVLRRFGDTNILRNRNPTKLPVANAHGPHYRASVQHQQQQQQQVQMPSPAPAPMVRQTLLHGSVGDLLSLDASDGSTASSSYRQHHHLMQHNHHHHHHNHRPHGPSGSSASNLSAGSATTLSDSNSLDSMEHEIVHQKRSQSQTAAGGRGPADQSYLGPFNFRQLLRPTQGPTESLRKRRGINLSLTPPPMQKGKT